MGHTEWDIEEVGHITCKGWDTRSGTHMEWDIRKSRTWTHREYKNGMHGVGHREWETGGVGHIQSGTHTDWETHRVRRIRGETHTEWDIQGMGHMECDTNGVKYRCRILSS